jgi:hypothetical protein
MLLVVLNSDTDLLACHLIWFGLVWFGLVWFDLIWFDLVWFMECTTFATHQ